MRILMVTPYPPLRDGIASYALQSVVGLRTAGHDVEVLSPGPSAAHQHLDLVGPRGALALAKRVDRYDKVIVQFHPEVFYRAEDTPWRWAVESLALSVAFGRCRQVEVRLHEIDYRRGSGRGLFRYANRLPWHVVDRVVVHTDAERKDFAEAYRLSMSRITVAEHGADFRPRTKLSKDQARASLGLPEDDFIFLNIGFIQPHKGFDRAVRAMGMVAAEDGSRRPWRLDVVGSVRTSEPAYLAYLSELRDLADRVPSVHLHEGYVSDELFDRWIVASDVVVLPYRSIWSSGVLERALLYGRPVIATNVGGLAYQRGERDLVTLVEDDAGLWRAMRKAALAFAGEANSEKATAERWVSSDSVNRQAVQMEVQRRAALSRGPGTPRLSGPAGTLSKVSAAVRNLPPLGIPQPLSSRPGGGLVKRLIRRMTAWEIDPLVYQVNALREATAKALERLPR